MTASPVDLLLTEMAWAHRLARRLAGGDADADEVVQDAYAAAVRHPPRIDRPLRPWLARVLRNQARDRWRSDDRRLRREAEVAPAAGAAGPTPDVLHEQLEAHRRLVDAVAALAEPYRETVRLRYFEDLSSAQIAARLGVPAATVRSRLKAALDRLRAALDQSYGERNRWVRLLVPVPATAAGLGSRPLVPAARLAVTVVVAAAALGTAVFLVGRQAPSSPLELLTAAAARIAGPPAAQAGSSPRGGAAPPSLGATSAAMLPACHQRLTALRRESLQLERTLWVRGHHRSLFPLGADNPAAAQVVLPMVTRIVRAGRAEPPPLALECRTFACELRVLERGEGGRALWLRPVQNDEQLRQHRRGIGFIGAGRPVRDPVAGREMIEYRLGFTLRHPSGAALDWEGPPVGPDAVAAMAAFLPAGVQECEAQASSLERTVAARREAAARDQPIEERFGQAARDPALEQRMWQFVRQGHGADVSDLSVECRGRICRVRDGSLWAPLFSGWSKPMTRWMRDRHLWVEHAGRGDTVYLRLSDGVF